ncbi:TPA: response regulator transcription factor [Streptococcus agalactiae]|uniref:response regulator transcription factor n=1 Tax=Streptococcus anginosus TaxID=1328 RepID=UPI00124791F0|nr:response regulator transcription factor [Streptococcus anginosus]HEO0409887.1 response regulator transcription factor [Streptococcus agalactiae]KAA9261245.1 response regulator transcription factor [Streptococcus anginosus]HEO0411346.1 response regulator transcription factor [Streptococcus agalactiae]HEO0430524.1 response regulator transcription factor [Streptococcus agalactiae]HEO0431695.1 response regulator transcription factor [Streptococcus agalactiae]
MKILLIEDHKMVATSLKMSLETDESISVDIVNNVRDLSINESVLNYDLLLIDINLTGIEGTINGLDVAEELINKYGDLKIVILTAYKLDFYIKRAKRIGCKGFISKEEETSKLIEDIKSIALKGRAIFPEDNHMLEPLTKNEIHIVKLYSNGLSRKELAKELNTNVRSLAVSLSRIYQKLGVRNYQEMIDKVLELGYVDSF